MPIFLKAEEDMLVVTMGKLSKAEFSDALDRMRSIPGRRYNPNGERGPQNEFPLDADTCLRVMQLMEPIADAECQAMVQRAARETADALVTKLPDDATLLVPYADKLRPYQRSAVDWLCDRPKSILADEMGLGKTVEALTVVDEYQQRSPSGEITNDDGTVVKRVPGPTLIIAPNAVRGVWREHVMEWWAERDPYVQVLDGKNPAKRQSQLNDPDATAFIVNWEKLRIMPELAKKDWGAIIADEAHRAKNKEAQQTKALFRLQAPVMLALTGTPVMNHPGELWSLLRWLRPEQFSEQVKGGGYWPFYYAYVQDYVVGKHQRIVTGVKNVDQLRFLLSDKLVRRTKKRVLKDLPDKAPLQVIEVELTSPERKLYEEVETALILDMQKFARRQAEAEDAVTIPGDITTVEQRTAEVLERLASMPLEKLAGLVDNGGTRMAKLRQITAGAKVKAAVELIRDEPETPVVAFTWHVQAARDLAESLRKGKPALRVGEIAADDDSDGPKDDFQAGELDHLVCTISKGGTGLTLTRSSNPLLVEEDWVPANNLQAIDRTHRYGQDKTVTPRVLRVPGTIDTGKIAPANRIKSMIATAVLGDD